MQKCFYHAKTDAATMCMGCKMPICATCRDEGKKGFCESCMRKVASLGDQIQDTKKTGMVQSVHKATMIKTAGRGTAPKNVTYCFHHFDIVATSTCPTCSRAFCPACLNTSGICSHCAKHSAEAQERMFAPNERGRRVLEEQEAEAKKRRWGAKEYAIAVIAVLAMGVAWKHFHKPERAVDPTAQTLQKLHDNELSADEQALLGKLQSAKKVNMPEPAATPVPQQAVQGYSAAAGTTASGHAAGAPAHAASLTGGARPRAAGGGAVHVGIRSPGNGASVSGVTPIQVGLSGTPGRIDLYVDGEWSGSINSYPFRFDWASQAVSNGTHHLTVKALGESGVLSQSGITVHVNN